MLYTLWQPASAGNEYLFFFIGEVTSVFVDAALGVQDCLLGK